MLSGIAVEHAQVYGRLVKAEDQASGILPKAPEVILEADKKHFVLSDGALGKRYELSGGVDIGGKWEQVVDVEAISSQALLKGQTACILGLGIGYHHYRILTSIVRNSLPNITFPRFQMSPKS